MSEVISRYRRMSYEEFCIEQPLLNRYINSEEKLKEYQSVPYDKLGVYVNQFIKSNMEQFFLNLTTYSRLIFSRVEDGISDKYAMKEPIKEKDKYIMVMLPNVSNNTESEIRQLNYYEIIQYAIQLHMQDVGDADMQEDEGDIVVDIALSILNDIYLKSLELPDDMFLNMKVSMEGMKIPDFLIGKSSIDDADSYSVKYLIMEIHNKFLTYLEAIRNGKFSTETMKANALENIRTKLVALFYIVETDKLSIFSFNYDKIRDETSLLTLERYLCLGEYGVNMNNISTYIKLSGETKLNILYPHIDMFSFLLQVPDGNDYKTDLIESINESFKRVKRKRA